MEIPTANRGPREARAPSVVTTASTTVFTQLITVVIPEVTRSSIPFTGVVVHLLTLFPFLINFIFIISRNVKTHDI